MTPYDKRNCFNCITKVENEEKVLLECPLYKQIKIFVSSCSVKLQCLLICLIISVILKKFVICSLKVELAIIVPKSAKIF